MKGLELAESYYFACGKPMIQELFPEYAGRIAAGLAGQGSECLGFDDAISTDHDFGPSFCLWLTEEDAKEIGNDLQDAYDRLPKDYLGAAGRIASARGGGRVGVFTIQGFYRQFIGSEQPPKSLMRWLYLPEHQLAAATSGRVFEDPWENFPRSGNRSWPTIRKTSGSKKSRPAPRSWPNPASTTIPAACGAEKPWPPCFPPRNLCGQPSPWFTF